MGNAMADTWAKHGTHMRQVNSRDIMMVIECDDWSRKVANELGKAIGAWPSTIDLFSKLPKSTKQSCEGEGSKSFRNHQFEWLDGRRRCKECWLLPRKSEAYCASKCSGAPDRISNVLKDHRGHDLRMGRTIEADFTTLWCACCGAFATTVPKYLSRPCMGRKFKTGQNNLHFFRKGIHPTSFDFFDEYFEVPVGS